MKVGKINAVKYLFVIMFALYTGCGCMKTPKASDNSHIWGKEDVAKEKADHPRLLLFADEEKEIKEQIAKDPVYGKIHSVIIDASDLMLEQPFLERKVAGGRLLAVSSEFLKRAFYLSYAYRLTKDSRYLSRAEKEMLQVASFSDWHPEHFLDVAEMTMAMSIGYDWLYNSLSDRTKEKLRLAIVEKGLKPSLKNNDWATKKNNWNQVCNASLAFGAISVHDYYPELSERIMSRAYRTLTLPMEQYAPDGLYQEGYGYWNYGTSFNVLFLAAVEKYFKDDKGLSGKPGFLKTADFMVNMVGQTGLPYNWSDNDLKAVFSPAMIWFAGKNSDKSLLWSEKRIFEASGKGLGDRLLPAAMIYGRKVAFKNIEVPASKCYFGNGANSVALMRSSWTDPDAVYIGYKLGSPGIPHSHLDVGSFVMEADGVRWAEDPGRQKYESIEKYGNIWRYDQNAFRWKIFRLGSMSHNLITVNGNQIMASGSAKLDKVSGEEKFKFAVSDLSSMYAGQLAGLSRGVAIVNNEYVVVRDEYRTLDKETTLRWAMFTSADVVLKENAAELSFEGKKLLLKVKGDGIITMNHWKDFPLEAWDQANPGKSIVGFELKPNPGSSGVVEVLLIPEKSSGLAAHIDKKLSEW